MKASDGQCLFRTLCVLGILLFFWRIPDGTAEIYRWENGSGQIHYSSTPPSYTVKGTLEVKRNNRWYPYTGHDAYPNTTSEKTQSVPYTTSFPVNPLPLDRSQEQTVIPYRQYQSMIVVDVLINGKLSRPFAVDTGATYTVISEEIARELYLKPTSDTPRVTLQTANGQIQVPLITLNSLALKDVESAHVTAAIHHFEKSSAISGLLGLNFLNRFQLTVDAAKNQLLLTPIASDCVTARELLDRGHVSRNGSDRKISYYRRAIALCPDLLEAYYVLGAIYIEQREAQRAVELHQRLLRKVPMEPEAHFRFGLSYLLQQNIEQARQEFQKTLQLDPHHLQAKEYLERLKNL